jgi:hypothetical protein
MADLFPGLNMTVVCGYCLNNNKNPNVEINFKDQTIYYVCPECKKENMIVLRVETTPYPRSRRM